MTHGQAIMFLPLRSLDRTYHDDYWNGVYYRAAIVKWHRHRVFCRTLNATRANWQVRYRFFRGCCVAIFKWRGTR